MTTTIILILLIVDTSLSITALLAAKMNNDEIEAIKSWYPFCEILKIKIPEKDDFDFDNGESDKYE